jgi:hypothetical protein
LRVVNLPGLPDLHFFGFLSAVPALTSLTLENLKEVEWDNLSPETGGTAALDRLGAHVTDLTLGAHEADLTLPALDLASSNRRFIMRITQAIPVLTVRVVAASSDDAARWRNTLLAPDGSIRGSRPGIALVVTVSRCGPAAPW